MPEVISVTELNSRVKELFARTPAVNDIWVTGEISNLKKYPSGHYYFVLKDPTSEIRATMFASARGRLDFEPKENMKITAFGKIDMYVQRGSYQFIVETMKQSGIGDRYITFEALKKKLQGEGLFDQTRKREIPRYPKRIGVVTSATGAVIHDIITTSASRYTADIILAPAMVQGEGAAESIVAGIKLLNKINVDVIIVGRGGGSIEDLWAFNEEIVARAIYESQAPVVSAVGHETDFTIADFVADLRAPTPTGAAALILRDKNEIRSELRSFESRLNRAMDTYTKGIKHRFEVLDAKLDPENAMNDIDMRSIHLDELSKSMDYAFMQTVSTMRNAFNSIDSKLRPESALMHIESLDSDMDRMFTKVSNDCERIMERCTARLDSYKDRPERAIKVLYDDKSNSLVSDSRHLEGVSPYNVLERGYSMITADDGSVVTSVEGIRIGEPVSIRFRDGTAKAEVKEKEKRT